MRDIAVLRSLGGCGGTLVSRVLAATPGAVLLSETNPRSANIFSGALNPIVQLFHWNADFLPEGFHEHEIGYPPFFGDFIEAVDEKVRAVNRKLVIRDYNYIDLIGVPFVIQPGADLSLDLALSGRYNIIDAFLVRHPADQLASLLKHGAVARILTPHLLLQACLTMMALRPGIPIVRYETLVQSQEEGFSDLCHHLGLTFAEAALHDLRTAEMVTGNLARITDEIELLPRSAHADSLHEALRADPLYEEVMHCFGYEP